MAVTLSVTIPSWPPLPSCQEMQEENDEENIQTLVRMHTTSVKEDMWDYGPEEEACRSATW